MATTKAVPIVKRREHVESPSVKSTWKKPTKAITYIIDERGCHICTSHQPDNNNYPIICVDKKLMKVHRVVYMKYYGPIPKGMYICHKCDNKRCINPKHFFLGTPRDNFEDMVKKNRHKYHYFTREEMARRVYPRGSKAHQAKLTDAQAAEIRKAPKGYGTGVALAKKYGVSESVISSVRVGRKYNV